MDDSKRMPAEWEPHRAAWLAWPARTTDWTDNLGAARAEWAGLVRAVAERGGERVEVLVADAAAAEEAAAAIDCEGVVLHQVRYGDVWLRDTGPTFVRSGSGALVAACFRFNGWGGRFPSADDERVAADIARLAGASCSDSPLVFEGGALDTDGCGRALVGRASVLGANRNPHTSAAAAEAELARVLGIESVVWLDGVLAGDHTDGHADTLARFFEPGRVLCMVPSSSDDPNAEVYAEVRRRLESARDAGGARLDIVEVPGPGRVEDEAGDVMPASYMNFYIANEAVIVPVYGAPEDRRAVDAIAACFPGREALALSAREIVTEGGAFHCLTQQEPLAATVVGAGRPEGEGER